MAKKLRKVGTPPRLLLIEFLIPWVVMGVAAIVGLSVGFGDIWTTLFALACALMTTFLVRIWERRRRLAVARLEAESYHRKESKSRNRR